MPPRFKIFPLLVLSCVLGFSLPCIAAADVPQSPPTLMVTSDSAIEIQPDALPFNASQDWLCPEPLNQGGWSGGPGLGPGCDRFTWQVLPDGLMYRSYLAGEREPRISSEFVHDQNMGGLWNVAVGGRAGILRYGSQDALSPEGYQVDIEAAAFPRILLDYERDLAAVDFRFGVPLTMRFGPWETKFECYHLSSHLGNQYMLANPDVSRINFSRDALLLGLAYRPIPDVRIYGEVGWAFYTWGETEPWEFQFGIEFSPAWPSGLQGAPFAAINAHLRQEVDFGGVLTVQAGWQWRGSSGHLFRLGLEYLNGKSEQYQFSDKFEQQLGGGIWYDF